MKKLTLTLSSPGLAVDGEEFPARTITMEWSDGATWWDILGGFRDALNGLGYSVPQLGEVEDCSGPCDPCDPCDPKPDDAPENFL